MYLCMYTGPSIVYFINLLFYLMIWLNALSNDVQNFYKPNHVSGYCDLEIGCKSSWPHVTIFEKRLLRGCQYKFDSWTEKWDMVPPRSLIYIGLGAPMWCTLITEGSSSPSPWTIADYYSWTAACLILSI